jgi:hypothetical protein
MATQYYFLKGKVKWFRPDRQNDWGKWSHVLYPDPESLAIIRKLQESTSERQGIRNVLKRDEETNEYFISIGRASKRKRLGKEVGNDPPLVFDGTKPLPDGSLMPFKDPVGNGSDVTTKVSYYTYPVPGSKTKGTAIRWESSRIDCLVPYAGTSEYTQREMAQEKGLKDVSPQF